MDPGEPVGMARYAPMDSDVRAVGRIVVWVEADAEVRTETTSRISMTVAEGAAAEDRGAERRGRRRRSCPRCPSPTPSVADPGEGDGGDVTIA